MEILAGSDYYIKFYPENYSLQDQNNQNSFDLSEKIKNAITKSPKWIQRDLLRQFKYIDNKDKYADLILNSSTKYTDEIAFSIAFSPLGDIADPDVIWDNTIFLYEIDKFIHYADIIDYDDGYGNYYSTVKYYIIENETLKQLEYPKEIYYWYIVHPELLGENPEVIYEKFWREYLFYHNDINYPLLKEKLSNILYLWDCKSYTQYGNRLWKNSFNEHPTAIEAISYWIGKTVPHLAIGDRPNQPNIIAHEHNGFCGELQRIAVALQRLALIPSIGACNYGEDHVWREFYERGWHQNDNWWADTGGTVDMPKIYADGWGKDMSAIYVVNGDGSINDVTSKYIDKDDRVTIKFSVNDFFNNPIDGTLITVFVKGIKDISWYKYKVLEIIEQIWENIPDILKGKILQFLYGKFENRINEVPDIIDGLTATIWNYTNQNGECTFTLGKNDEYLFLIQQPNLDLPWFISKYNVIRTLRNTEDNNYKIFFPDLSNRITPHKIDEISSGNYFFNVTFNTISYQLNKNIRDNNIGKYIYNGSIDFFILDEENFVKYKNGKKFSCFNYIENNKGYLDFNSGENELYFVFRNHAQRTNIELDFSIEIKTDTNKDIVKIVQPYKEIFDEILFNVGDNVEISGIATYNSKIIINNESIDLSINEGKWTYIWNTSKLTPIEYLIKAEYGNIHDEILINLIDENPPNLEIKQPFDDMIFEENDILITGESWDNYGIDKVEISLDNHNYSKAIGTNEWYAELDISNNNLGRYSIFIRSTDKIGKKSIKNISFIKNESGHQWNPKINDIYHYPEKPTNTSNIIIFANVTKNNPFDVKKVELIYKNMNNTYIETMYNYGEKPIQNRHDEDPLINIANKPIFGYELGHFNSGETIIYQIIAYDYANNNIKSNETSIYIE